MGMLPECSSYDSLNNNPWITDENEVITKETNVL